ncbi:MAG: toll/interleukin-1 receptor domain-containing protein [Candidatus Scalindua sp.]
MTKSDQDTNDFKYDVCLSFADEDRKYVRDVASQLTKNGIRVFYDEYEEIELWGKDLYVHLDETYRNAARYCVLFISEHYAKKIWTNHERQSAQARALTENQEYILPARFDDTEIPGLKKTIGYIDLINKTADEFATIIYKKIGGRSRSKYFPPMPDKLLEYLEVKDEDEQVIVINNARNFFSVLQRMTDEEQIIIFSIFRFGCPADLPENMHINIDLLQRHTGFTQAKIKRIIGNLNSLGFTSKLREDTETEGHLGLKRMLVVYWIDMSIENGGPATDVADGIITLATEGFCEECGNQALKRLDFGQLASVTWEEDHHQK